MLGVLKRRRQSEPVQSEQSAPGRKWHPFRTVVAITRKELPYNSVHVFPRSNGLWPNLHGSYTLTEKEELKMGYMTVEEHSVTLLHLKRSPGIRSWSLLVGIASVGLAAAYYSSDSILWKLFYITGCLFVAMQNMEEWEEAVFDKTKNLIELKSLSLYTLVLTLWRKGHEKIVLDLTQLCDVCIQEERVRYLGKGYVLMLRLAAGFSYPLTQSATLGGRSDVEAVAALLKRFLGLEELQQRRQQEEEAEYGEEEEEEEDSLDNSSDSDDEEDQP